MTPLPQGDYVVMMTKSEEKPFKDPTSGTKCAITFQVVEGEYKNRLLWVNLNLNHHGKPTSAKTVEIARQELRSIQDAIGKINIADTSELHGIPIIASVGLKKGCDNVVRNEVTKYTSTTAQGAPMPAAQPAPVASGPGDAPF